MSVPNAFSDGTALSRAVHALLHVRSDGGDVIAPLLAYVSANGAPVKQANLLKLATELAIAPPGQLANAIIGEIDVTSLSREQGTTQKSLGLFHQRALAARELLTFAKLSSGEDRLRLARASLLLPAQEGFVIGIPTLSFLICQPDFEGIAQVGVEAIAKLRLMIEFHLNRTSNFFTRFRATSEALRTKLRSSPAAPPKDVRVLLDELDPIVRLTHQRPDLQWQLAHLLYAVRCLAKSISAQIDEAVNTKVEAWCKTVPDAAFKRWCGQAISMEPNDSSTMLPLKSATTEQLAVVT